MSDTSLPRDARIDLDWYRKAAKKRLRSLRARKPSAKLAEAQLAIAREHGFASWRKLAASVASPPVEIDPALVKQFAEAMNRDRGDIDAIRTLLDAHPELANCHPWAPQWPHTAIEAAAHQCVWHRPKMVEIAQLLIDRGATADLPTIARAGLLEEVKRRLDADPSLVNVPDIKGRTAIYRAACTYGFLKESIPVVEELIRRGAAVDVFTAASWLMIERLTPMLKQLPDFARLKDPEGLTALHWVTRTDPADARQEAAAKLLLDAGADPNAEATSNNGMRPLHCAAEWPSSIELAGLLIDRGAEINARSSQSDWTPLDYAIDRNREQMRDFLRSRGARTRQDLATTDDAAVDSFLRSVLANDLPAVRQRLDESPELIHRTGKHPQWAGRPQALHVAIESDRQEMFDLLLARNANPAGDNASYDHWSPLMLAIHWKRNAMRDELINRLNHLSLIDTLMLGDDAAARRILSAGAIMLQRPMPNDATMLHFARTKTAAERLIELGVPIDAKDKYNKTALDLAAEKGVKEVVDLLIEHGAQASPVTFARLGDLDRLKKSAGKQDITAPLLMAAIQGKNEKVVKWIVAQGVDVNEPNATGATALHFAAFEGLLSIAKLLVKAGANVHAEDDEYDATPSGWSMYAGQNLNRKECGEVTAYLEQQMAKKFDVKKLPERRQTHAIVHWKPIMDAAFTGDAKRIEKLVEEGADPNAVSTTPGAHRPLHRAIENKKTSPRTAAHERAVETLLKLGADPHQRGGYARLTALQMAAIDSPQFVPVLSPRFTPFDFFHACVLLDRKRVETLLKKDKLLARSRDLNGYTGLHYVAASRLYGQSDALHKAQLALAKLLIDAGADVNATFPYTGGDYPIPVLHFACGFHNNPELTELLLKAGAMPYDNESIYHASDEGHDACLAILEKYADKRKLKDEATKCLRTQFHWGKSRGAKWLLEHGADPNSPYPPTGNAAIHSAAKYGANEKVIAMLLAHGADPKRKNKEGKTAIDIAKEAKKPRVVAQLKSGGRK